MKYSSPTRFYNIATYSSLLYTCRKLYIALWNFSYCNICQNAQYISKTDTWIVVITIGRYNMDCVIKIHKCIFYFIYKKYLVLFTRKLI